MRPMHFWVLFVAFVAVVSFLAGTLVPVARTDTPSPKYFMVNYMKVIPGQDPVKIEREMWKPLHQEFIKEGQFRSWAVYGLQFPSGTDEKYDYATVHAFDKFGQLENPFANFDKILAKVHPGVKVDDFINRTEKTRNLVRSEVWVLVDKAE
jgi:hypothetical protein